MIFMEFRGNPDILLKKMNLTIVFIVSGLNDVFFSNYRDYDYEESLRFFPRNKKDKFSDRQVYHFSFIAMGMTFLDYGLLSNDVIVNFRIPEYFIRSS